MRWRAYQKLGASQAKLFRWTSLSGLRTRNGMRTCSLRVRSVTHAYLIARVSKPQYIIKHPRPDYPILRFLGAI